MNGTQKEPKSKKARKVEEIAQKRPETAQMVEKYYQNYSRSPQSIGVFEGDQKRAICQHGSTSSHTNRNEYEPRS